MSPYCFFKPAHGLNPELEARYAANILGFTRQLHFSPKNEKSLDVTLSINGVPLITLELKNPLSNQTVADVINTEEVHMTTRLAGTSTYFLPFNQGRDGGTGNLITEQIIPSE